MRWISLAVFMLSPLIAAARSALPLQAELLTDREIYLSGASNKIFLDTHLFGAENGPALQPSKRNIAFVLDRSGSMAGARMENLMKAVAAAVRSLGDQDVVSIVSFGSEIETVVEAKTRDQLDRLDALLAQIEPSGGSALYDALNQGAALVRRNLGPTSINHVILVTDGPATKGPRDPADFSRLAEVFAGEGIGLSTIGIGADSEEDLLAGLARTGRGHFGFADKPESLMERVAAEVRPLQHLIARDVTATFNFNVDCEKLESYSWTPATIQGQSATFNLPYLYAGQDVHLLIEASMRARQFSYKLVILHLTWKDPGDGGSHEIVKTIQIDMTSDEMAVQRSANAVVARTLSDGYVRQGLQDAIAQIDKGDLRQALRPLRRVRDDLYSLNFRLDDAEVAGKIRQYESFLNEVRARGVNRLDRKIFRSGVLGQFGIPTAEDASDY